MEKQITPMQHGLCGAVLDAQKGFVVKSFLLLLSFLL